MPPGQVSNEENQLQEPPPLWRRYHCDLDQNLVLVQGREKKHCFFKSFLEELWCAKGRPSDPKSARGKGSINPSPGTGEEVIGDWRTEVPVEPPVAHRAGGITANIPN